MPLLSFHCRHAYESGFELDLAFEMSAGAAALFGPSGSGKTTTLLLIAGLLRPAAGEIRLDGRTLLDTAARVSLRPERRRIGMLFQDHALFPHLNVRRNLAYGQRRRPWRQLDFDRVVDSLELGDLLDRRPATLSGGEKQRVALGRALLRGPELLLMDEPVVSLDAPLRQRVLELIERVIAEFEIPTLLVSHDAGVVRRLAQQAIVLSGGRKLRTGDPAEVLPAP